MNTNTNNLPAGYTKRSIDTDAISFFSADMMLQIRFLDRTSLSIAFRPLQLDDSGARKFPKKEGDESFAYNIILKRDDAITLSDRIEKYFVPKFAEYVENRIADPSFDKETSTGIMMVTPSNGKTRVLDIYSGKPGANGYEPKLRLISEINNDRIATKVVEFTFGTGMVIDDYAPETGEFKLASPVFPQLILFKRVLDAFAWACTSSASHDVTVRFQQRLKDLTDTIDQVAIKNGVTPKHTTFGYTEKKETSLFAPVAAPVADMKEMSLESIMSGNPF